MAKKILIIVGVVLIIMGYFLYSTGEQKFLTSGGNIEKHKEAANYKKAGGLVAILGIGVIIWGIAAKQSSKSPKT